jgi:ribose 5-phosphate isomerase B
MGYRVVVAADSAGYSYKELIRQDLESDRRVDEVIDAGLSEGKRSTIRISQ